MGFFDVCCSESGVPLGGCARLMLIAEESAGRWVPIALPLEGCYDRSGGIDLPSEEPGEDAVLEEFCRGLGLGSGSLGEILGGMRGGECGNWQGRQVSYALFDDAVYQGIARSAARGEGPDAVRRLSEAGASMLDFNDPALRSGGRRRRPVQWLFSEGKRRGGRGAPYRGRAVQLSEDVEAAVSDQIYHFAGKIDGAAVAVIVEKELAPRLGSTKDAVEPRKFIRRASRGAMGGLMQRPRPGDLEHKELLAQGAVAVLRSVAKLAAANGWWLEPGA